MPRPRSWSRSRGRDAQGATSNSARNLSPEASSSAVWCRTRVPAIDDEAPFSSRLLLPYREILAEALNDGAVHAAAGEDGLAHREAEITRCRGVCIDRPPVERSTGTLLLVEQRVHRLASDDDLRAREDDAVRRDVLGEGDASPLQIGGEGEGAVGRPHLTGGVGACAPRHRR